MEQVRFSDIELKRFWEKRIKINREATIPMIYDRFSDTGRFAAFRCDWKDGDPCRPHIFWDSDVAKWIEAASYSIQLSPDKELEKKIDDTVDLIEKNQWDDGYFNIYYTVVEPGKRFTNRDNHELYCAGHLTEAAVAYYYATGKDKFLRIMCRYMDCIEKAFITEKTASFSTPGHEEIELALIKLYNCTGEKRYLEMCRHFIENRGRCENDLNCRDWCDSRYDQSDKPVRELPEAFGHSVRAMYLYAGMADLARETGDESLFEACDRLFESAAHRKMYITGGIGSTREGEAFAKDYVLPNDLAYSETCASIGLAYFARRMALYCPDSKYADAAELAIYNCALAGVSLDGKAFFYVNPLEINIEDYKVKKEFYKSRLSLLTQRVEVFDCSCCPPNIARFVASIGDFLYSFDENTVYAHHFAESEADFNGINIVQQTLYPNEGEVRFTVRGMRGRKFAVRIPGWCSFASLNGSRITGGIRRGYVYVDITEDEQVLDFYFEMKAVFVASNPLVESNLGRVCICRGPIVYCAESVLNDGVRLNSISVSTEETPGLIPDEKTGVYAMKIKAYEDLPSDKLYREYSKNDVKERELRLLPYFAFANNGESDMLIWLRVRN